MRRNFVLIIFSTFRFKWSRKRRTEVYIARNSPGYNRLISLLIMSFIFFIYLCIISLSAWRTQPYQGAHQITHPADASDTDYDMPTPSPYFIDEVLIMWTKNFQVQCRAYVLQIIPPWIWSHIQWWSIHTYRGKSRALGFSLLLLFRLDESILLKYHST
jgi:hypothetical protein